MKLDKLKLCENEHVTQMAKRAGIVISDVFDLIGIKLPDTFVIELLNYLGKIEHPTIKQGIIRSLSDKKYDKIVKWKLLDYYRAMSGDGVQDQDTKWVLGNAIGCVSSAEIMDEMIDIVINRSNGKSRQMIVYALKDFHDQKVVDVIADLIYDKDVSTHAIYALGFIGNETSISSLEKIKISGDKLSAREAQKAIERINKKRNYIRRFIL